MSKLSDMLLKETEKMLKAVTSLSIPDLIDMAEFSEKLHIVVSTLLIVQIAQQQEKEEWFGEKPARQCMDDCIANFESNIRRNVKINCKLNDIKFDTMCEINKDLVDFMKKTIEKDEKTNN